MFDPKSYRKACDSLSIDAEKIEEMISMTENQDKKTHIRRPLRVVMLAAAMVAALGITASAAEIPAVQEFFATIFVTVTTEDVGLNLPSVAMEDRKGRSILIVNGEETDVTDALFQEGEYLYEGDGFEVVVDESGAAVVTAYGADGMTVTYSTEDGEAQGGPVYKVTADDESVSNYNISVDTVEADALKETYAEGMASYEVIADENGAILISPASEKE